MFPFRCTLPGRATKTDVANKYVLKEGKIMGGKEGEREGGREGDYSSGSEVWMLSPGEPQWAMQMRWLQQSVLGA